MVFCHAFEASGRFASDPRRRRRGRGLALSKDRSTAGTAFDAGFGRVLDAQMGAPIADLRVTSVHQEHGEISSAHPLPWDALPIGGLVRIVPNHVCMTAAMYGQYHLIGAAGQIGGVWSRTNGWAAPSVS